MTQSEMRLTILGCGSASPSPRHLPSAQALEWRGRLMLLDCGEGTQLAMMKARLPMTRLSDIFLTHLHGDHCLGVPGLLSTLSLHQKGGTITIHTFAEGGALLRPLVDFLCRERSFDLRFNILEPGRRQTAADFGGLTVETLPLRHRVPTLGYLLREAPKPRHIIGDMVRHYQVPVRLMADIKAGADYVTPDGQVIANGRLTTDADPSRSYAYCTDTLYMGAELADMVRGVDLLYHEATYADDEAHKAAARFHSTASQAAQVAEAAGAGRLLIGHYSKQYDDEEQHLRQARDIFPDTILAREGLRMMV